jgi:hypothetical protein
MARRSHPKKEVEQAIQYAELNGWRVTVGGSHAWGKLYCPDNDSECRCGVFCITSIWSTPRNATSHARDIKRVVDHCTANSKHHRAGDQPDQGEPHGI